MRPPLEPPPVQFLDVSHLHLVEGDAPVLSPEEDHAVDVQWNEALARQPDLFDGPVIVCMNTRQQGTGLTLEWARSTYRLRALRNVPGRTGWMPASVFVTVLLPTEDTGLVLGRESAASAHPGRWHLPGGTAEPPAAQAQLHLSDLRAHAAQELAEEVGVSVTPAALTLRAVSRGEHGNLGIHFQAPITTAAEVFGRHREVARAQRSHGHEPELDQLAVIRSPEQLRPLGPYADYLPGLLDRYSTGPTSRSR